MAGCRALCRQPPAATVAAQICCLEHNSMALGAAAHWSFGKAVSQFCAGVVINCAASDTDKDAWQGGLPAGADGTHLHRNQRQPARSRLGVQCPLRLLAPLLVPLLHNSQVPSQCLQGRLQLCTARLPVADFMGYHAAAGWVTARPLVITKMACGSFSWSQDGLGQSADGL